MDDSHRNHAYIGRQDSIFSRLNNKKKRRKQLIEQWARVVGHCRRAIVIFPAALRPRSSRKESGNLSPLAKLPYIAVCENMSTR